MYRFVLCFVIIISISCDNTKQERKNKSQQNQDTVQVKEIKFDTVFSTKVIVDTVYIEKIRENEYTQSIYYIHERLPDWFLDSKLLDGKKFKNKYLFENRLNPLYLER
jgi:hypothetical protein